ncbi:MAG TPA: thiamine-phosphate kinase, partial [Ktedonobacterales bacterium]|nr:thiamine-phosphate kinase [Ktedonobacterales bacterium]
IARLTAGLPLPADVVVGVGDDAAVIDLGDDRVLVATCDALVEDVHFRLRTVNPESLGRRALAVNLSDCAAMGAIPRFALISLLAPRDTDTALLDAIYAGLRAEAEAYGVAIVGGNVARNPERLILDITLLGMGRRHRLLLRSGARAGDAIGVTGTVGTAAAGLLVVEDGQLAAQISVEGRATVLQAIHTPSPRVAAGQWLADHGATAAIDISDGLAADLGHLCTASGVGAQIDAATLPIAPVTREVAGATGRKARDLALFGGEDYELLFTVPAEQATALARQLNTAVGVPVTLIGTVTAESTMILSNQGAMMPLPAKGWNHMARFTLERG